MKKVWKYGISALFVALFALSALCGCGIFGSSPSYDGGESSSGGGQTERPASKPEFASGSGTKSDPYVISEGYQWANVANHLDAHYLLGADLNLGDLNNLQPIGDSTDPFTGTLDGQNHKIHSAEIEVKNEKLNHAGLFGLISGGTIRNLHLTDSKIKVGSDARNVAAGGIAGQVKMGANIENCHSKDVTIETDSGGNTRCALGAIIGTVSSASKVAYCSAKVGLVTDRPILTGGLFGRAEGGRVNCCWGIISLSSYPYTPVGGLIGKITGGKFSNIYAEISFDTLYGGIAYNSEGGYGVSLAFVSTVRVQTASRSTIIRISP